MNESFVECGLYILDGVVARDLRCLKLAFFLSFCWLTRAFLLKWRARLNLDWPVASKQLFPRQLWLILFQLRVLDWRRRANSVLRHHIFTVAKSNLRWGVYDPQHIGFIFTYGVSFFFFLVVLFYRQMSATSTLIWEIHSFGGVF